MRTVILGLKVLAVSLVTLFALALWMNYQWYENHPEVVAQQKTENDAVLRQAQQARVRRAEHKHVAHRQAQKSDQFQLPEHTRQFQAMFTDTVLRMGGLRH